MRAMDSCTGFVLWDIRERTLLISVYGTHEFMGRKIFELLSNVTVTMPRTRHCVRDVAYAGNL